MRSISFTKHFLLTLPHLAQDVLLSKMLSYHKILPWFWDPILIIAARPNTTITRLCTCIIITNPPLALDSPAEYSLQKLRCGAVVQGLAT